MAGAVRHLADALEELESDVAEVTEAFHLDRPVPPKGRLSLEVGLR